MDPTEEASHSDSTDTVTNAGHKRTPPERNAEEEERKSKRHRAEANQPPSERQDPAAIIPSFTTKQCDIYSQVDDDNPQLIVHFFPLELRPPTQERLLAASCEQYPVPPTP